MSATSTKVNKIVVYEHPDFKGLSKEFTSDVRDLRDFGFGDCISSVKVIGQPWILYENPHFKGWLKEYEEGQYSNTETRDKASSLRLITEDLKNSKITLYERAHFQGRMKTFTEETNLTFDHFNDIASSHTVDGGVWILYEHPNRGGWRVLARAGERHPDYGSFKFHDKVSHIRPLKAGRPIVTSMVLWDQRKQENEICSTIDEITVVNKSDFEQEFTSTRSKEYESSVTYDFKFSNTTSIEAGVEFGIKLIADVSTKISTSFTVEKGKSETITKRDKIELMMPAKVPPHTKMTATVLKKECTITVPVELTIEQNGKKTIEYGELRCAMGSTITVEYSSEKI